MSTAVQAQLVRLNTTSGIFESIGDGIPLDVKEQVDLLDVTLSTDTAIYADGDLLADTQSIANAFLKAGGTLVLNSVLVYDEDDQGVAMDLVFLSAANTLGTENAAPSITDALARDIVGKLSIATGDYTDLGGVRVAQKTDLNMILKAAGTSRILYVAAITRGGTPTYTASGIRLKLGVRY